MNKALTVAGSDSGGGAGIQTDLKTFAALGVYGTSVLTALTAQNTKGVHGIHAVPNDFIACQMEAVLSDIPVQAAKTGMLGDAGVIMTVVKMFTKYRVANLVVDPVMVAESGDRLLPESAVDALRDHLLPLALVVTPNLPEAEVLLGRKVDSVDAMIAAAREIRLMGPRNVLIKGGHLPGDKMIDVFFDGKQVYRFAEKKLITINTHGTGCTYAAAITAHLAKGATPLGAVTQAKKFITNAIAHGVSVGSGYGPTNPMGALLRELELGRAAKDLQKAVTLLQNTPSVAYLLAPAGTNIFYCSDGATTLSDIASYPAPLGRYHDSICAEEEPVFASGFFPAEYLLMAHKKDTRIRAIINLRHTPETALAASALGYKTVKLNGPFASLETIPEVLIIHDTPDNQPQILLLTRSAEEAAQKAASLARSFSQGQV